MTFDIRPNIRMTHGRSSFGSYARFVIRRDRVEPAGSMVVKFYKYVSWLRQFGRQFCQLGCAIFKVGSAKVYGRRTFDGRLYMHGEHFASAEKGGAPRAF